MSKIVKFFFLLISAPCHFYVYYIMPYVFFFSYFGDNRKTNKRHL